MGTKSKDGPPYRHNIFTIVIPSMLFIQEQGDKGASLRSRYRWEAVAEHVYHPQANRRAESTMKLAEVALQACLGNKFN